jgi:hypothetical protein
MRASKTLWMLDIPYGNGSKLVPLYAVDVQEAWVEANQWAVQHDVVLPGDATLVHFPLGFTVHRCVLPGRAEESTSERNNN